MHTRSAIVALLAASSLALNTVPAGADQGPENGRISFGREDPATHSPSLWVSDVDGENQHRLATDTTYFSDWAPNGTRIAFDFEDDTGVHIATIGANGQERRNLTSDPGVQECPKFSPDGQWITYDAENSDQEDFSTSIWVMRTDGSDVRRITTGGFDVEPVFSPDGTQIAFGRITGDAPTGQLEALYVVNVDGTGPREVVPPRVGLEHPDWSPDGKWITFNIGPEFPNAALSGDVLAGHPSGAGCTFSCRGPTASPSTRPCGRPTGRSCCWDASTTQGTTKGSVPRRRGAEECAWSTSVERVRSTSRPGV